MLPKPLLIDIGGLYISLRDREYIKDDPADPVGDYHADGHLLGLSTSISFLF